MGETVVRIDLGFVNAYLLRAGEGFVLVDTGMSSHGAKLMSALSAAGCKKGNLKLIVLTHADRDHVGNAAAVSAAFGAPIAIHEHDRSALEKGEVPSRKGRTALTRILVGLMSLARNAAKGPHPKADVSLTDGQSLAPYGLDAQVLHLPGHTPGSIALLLGDGSLIAGDVFANYKHPDVSPFVWSFDRYRESIEKVKGLLGSVSLVHPGHGSPFEPRLIRDMNI